MKPVSYERLTMKLQKAIMVIESNKGGTIMVDAPRGMTKLATNDIRYVEVTGHKLVFHTTQGNYVEYGSLSELEMVLRVYEFMRCNACYLVNPQHIKQLNTKDLLVIAAGHQNLRTCIHRHSMPPVNTGSYSDKVPWGGESSYD